MIVRHTHAARVSRNLCPLPFHRKGDRSVAQNAEVVTVVSVLPDVFARENDIAPESLLNSGVELVTKARIERSCPWHRTTKKRIQHRIRAPSAGKHQIFIKGSFQQSRIGHADDGVRLFDVVGDPEARLNLLVSDEAIVEIPAQT